MKRSKGKRGLKPTSDSRPRIWFGKHKGNPWTKVPKEYLDWVVENVGGSAATVASDELKRRKDARAETSSQEAAAVEVAESRAEEVADELDVLFYRSTQTWEQDDGK